MQPEDLQPGEERTSAFRAAEYVRMSTEHQQYSTQNQADKIREYAERRGIRIIRTYADEGKSGLRIDGREALQALLRDVESGNADFNVILVYDVRRRSSRSFAAIASRAACSASLAAANASSTARAALRASSRFCLIWSQ